MPESDYRMTYRDDISLRSFGNAIAELPTAVHDAIHDVYSLKGIRAWHDHFVLHLQKLVYMLGILISAIFLVNESDRVGRHPGKIDFVFVSRPLLYAVGADVLTIAINVLYMMTRFALEKHLQRYKEPAVWERMILHLTPVVAAVLLGLLAYSIPYCYLTTRYMDTPFCRSSFTPTLDRVLLVLAVVAAVAHMIYGVYHHWRSTSTVETGGRRGRSSEEDDDNDYEYARLLENGDDRLSGGRRSGTMRR